MDTKPAKPLKPLRGKAYGSIGHLPLSRTGPSDWHIHEGQARICLETPRKGDRIIVSEKLDGACMAVAKTPVGIISLSRAGYLADDAEYLHLKAFAPWVMRQRAYFDALLNVGERLVGEWMVLAHGTIYDAAHPGFSPFIAFDIIRGKERILRDEFKERLKDFPTAAVLHDGPESFSIEAALQALGTHGHHGSTEPAEGAVWRVEREGRVDFLAKFVRADKVDGKYLPGVNGNGDRHFWHFQDPA